MTTGGTAPDKPPDGEVPPQCSGHHPYQPRPRRVQLSRAKGWRMPPNTVKVDRATRWGNPFNATATHLPFDHRGYPIPVAPLRAPACLDRCLDLFAAYLRGVLTREPDFLEPLRGKNLACWCKPDQPCHADLLLRLANFDWGRPL